MINKRSMVRRSSNTTLLRRPDLVNDTLSILNTYSGSLYLPSPSSCYQDTAGTLPCVVDTPVGLMLDEMRTLGPELVVDPTFDNPSAWTVGGSTPPVVSGGQVSFNQAGSVYCYVRQVASFPALTVGKTYKITVQCTSFTAGLFRVVFTGGTATFPFAADITSAGTYTTHFVATQSNTGIELSRNGVLASYVATFDNISVREVTGIHATQATAGFKPILRFASGKYYEQFDGVDDRQVLSSVPFQMSDDFFVVVGCTSLSSTADGTIFSLGSSASNNPLISINFNITTGYIRAYWRDDVAGTTQILGATNLTSAPVVIAITSIGPIKKLYVNGVLIGTATSTLGAATFNTAAIGCRIQASPASFFNGKLHYLDYGIGAISDAQLLTTMRYAGQQAGVTI